MRAKRFARWSKSRHVRDARRVGHARAGADHAKSSPATSEIARQCVAAGASASARRPAPQRENRFRTSSSRRCRGPSRAAARRAATKSASFMPRERRADQARCAAGDEHDRHVVAASPGRRPRRFSPRRRTSGVPGRDGRRASRRSSDRATARRPARRQRRRRSSAASEAATRPPPRPSAARPCRRRKSRRARRARSSSASIARAVAGPGAAAATAASYNSNSKRSAGGAPVARMLSR